MLSVKQLNHFVEDEGILYPIEFKDLPFEPKRVFYVTDVPKDEERGLHAHHETEQILICIKGKILVKTFDANKNEHDERIIVPGESVYVGKLIWDSQIYLTGDDIMMSICSTSYDTEDYIHSIEEYKAMF